MCRFGYSFCIHSFVKNIPFLQFPIEFHKKSIPNFFFFLLMLQLYHLQEECELSVCTQGF